MAVSGVGWNARHLLFLMTDDAHIRAEQCLECLLGYLFHFRSENESLSDAFERYVLSINEYFDTETFAFSETSLRSFRVSCECAWSLSVTFPSNSTVEVKALELIVRRMVFHFATAHFEG